MQQKDLGNYPFSVDGYLRDNLESAKEIIRADWDMIFAVDGAEGVGKSVMAQQCAYICDPTICLSRIVFTPKEFRTAIYSAGKYEAIIYDEAYTGLNSRGAMSMVNRVLIEMIAEIRQKNLFVFIVMPTFFDLDRYVAIWRSRALIHCYHNDFQRGFFAWFDFDRKKHLYIEGKKLYLYGKPKANFIGRFTNHYVVDVTEYKKKKSASLLNRAKAQEEKEVKKEFQEELFNRLIAIDNSKMTDATKAEILGISPRTFYIWINKAKNAEET